MNLEELKLELLGGRKVLESEPCPSAALTLLSYDRMSDLEQMLGDISSNQIAGDVIEAGVWKGGACIFMRAVLNSLGLQKQLYVADSFEGVPPPDPKYPLDDGDYHHTLAYLNVSQEEVEANFRRFGLIENVTFVKGWFKDTLHLIDASFSLIRLDGDLYESTLDSMKAIYPKLSIGGYCIIDDWGATRGAGPAVRDYMERFGARMEAVQMTGPAAYWKKLT